MNMCGIVFVQKDATVTLTSIVFGDNKMITGVGNIKMKIWMSFSSERACFDGMQVEK